MTNPLTMQAGRLEAYGAPFQRVTVAHSVDGTGEALVRVAESGVNPLDLKIREGAAEHARQAVPAILEIDLA